LGWLPRVALQVASVIGADAKEIIFTSGATESNNLAIKGVAQFYKEKKNHVITTQVGEGSMGRFVELKIKRFGGRAVL